MEKYRGPHCTSFTNPYSLIKQRGSKKHHALENSLPTFQAFPVEDKAFPRMHLRKMKSLPSCGLLSEQVAQGFLTQPPRKFSPQRPGTHIPSRPTRLGACACQGCACGASCRLAVEQSFQIRGENKPKRVWAKGRGRVQGKFS